MQGRLPPDIWMRICHFLMLPNFKSFDRFQHRIKYLATISSVCKESRAAAQPWWSEFRKEYSVHTSRRQFERLNAFEPIVRGTNRWELKPIQHYFPSARKKSSFVNEVWEYFEITEPSFMPLDVLDAVRRDRSQRMRNFYHLRQLWHKRHPIARELISSPYQEYLNSKAGVACDKLEKAFGTPKGMSKALKQYKRHLWSLKGANYWQRRQCEHNGRSSWYHKISSSSTERLSQKPHCRYIDWLKVVKAHKTLIGSPFQCI